MGWYRQLHEIPSPGWTFVGEVIQITRLLRLDSYCARLSFARGSGISSKSELNGLVSVKATVSAILAYVALWSYSEGNPQDPGPGQYVQRQPCSLDKSFCTR